jgi:hypothetical protein
MTSKRIYIEILKSNSVELRAIKQPISLELVEIGNLLISLSIN